MALVSTFAGYTLSPTDASGAVRLYHGTDKEGANSILYYGLDEAKASACGGEGRFWCTTAMARAGRFAKYTLSDRPMIVEFDLPVAVLESCSTGVPPLMITHQVGLYPNFEFWGGSFDTLNASISNITITDARVIIEP